MKDFLSFLVKNIVDQAEDVVVTEENVGPGLVNLKLSVAMADMGKIIGKQGRIIRSVRDLVRVLAVKQNLRVNIDLQE